MVPEFHVEWSVFQHVLISLALGAIVGLERQAQQSSEGRDVSGVRTFALASLLGTTCALVYAFAPALAAIMAVGFLLLIGSHYVIDAHFRQRATGITTDTSALIVFALGAMVPTRPLLSASIAIIVTLLLSQKKIIHRSVEQLTKDELYATIKLLLVSVVFLPLLPTDPVDPWGVYVPRDIWFLVVLISALSFVGYFAMRLFGEKRGIAITGILGGLASSTALTLAMAGRVKADEKGTTYRIAAFAIVSANTVMIVRVLIEVGAVSPPLLQAAGLPLGILLVGSAVGAGGLWLTSKKDSDKELDEEDPTDTLSLENPFRLAPALKFGAVFVVIIGVVNLANAYYGDRGILLASVVGGLADSDATVLTAAKMRASGLLDEASAVRAVLLAVISNSLVKVGLGGFLGSPRLGLRVFLGLIPLIVAGVIAWSVA